MQLRWPGRNEPGSVCSTDARERQRQRGGEEGERFKVAAKLLRRRRGNILGLIVERWGTAGCARGFEVLWRSSLAHKAPSLYLAIHLSAPHFKGRGRDVGMANCAGVNPNVVAGREHCGATSAPIIRHT